jgi:hypothetical protein
VWQDREQQQQQFMTNQQIPMAQPDAVQPPSSSRVYGYGVEEKIESLGVGAYLLLVRAEGLGF